jgi:hypothetical protein
MRQGRKLYDWMPLRYLAAVAATAVGCLCLLLLAGPVPVQWSSSAAHVNLGTPHIELFRTPDSSGLSQRPFLGSRPLFHYSIIPGGVQNPEELQKAIAHDPVVAAHYAGFNLRKACVTRIEKDRSVYVSYRVGEKVFWTKKPLILTKGETVITDGAHMARTRCGNRISEIPMEPISPAEPPPQAIETAQDPGLLNDPGPVFELPLDPPPGTSIEVAEHHRGFFIPPFFPVYWEGPPSSPGLPVSPPPSTPPGGPTTPQPPPPSTQVSEPGTLFMLTAGLSSAWLLRQTSRR